MNRLIILALLAISGIANANQTNQFSEKCTYQGGYSPSTSSKNICDHAKECATQKALVNCQENGFDKCAPISAQDFFYGGGHSYGLIGAFYDAYVTAYCMAEAKVEGQGEQNIDRLNQTLIRRSEQSQRELENENRLISMATDMKLLQGTGTFGKLRKYIHVLSESGKSIYSTTPLNFVICSKSIGGRTLQIGDYSRTYASPAECEVNLEKLMYVSRREPSQILVGTINGEPQIISIKTSAELNN